MKPAALTKAIPSKAIPSKAIPSKAIPSVEKNQSRAAYTKDTASIYDDLFFFDSEGWDLTRKLIVKLKQEVELNGGKLALIHFGGMPRLDHYREFPALPLEQFDAFLESEGISYLNNFNLFLKIDPQLLNKNFIPNDGHFNEIGHRQFAEFSSDFLLNLINKNKV